MRHIETSHEKKPKRLRSSKLLLHVLKDTSEGGVMSYLEIKRFWVKIGIKWKESTSKQKKYFNLSKIQVDYNAESTTWMVSKSQLQMPDSHFLCRRPHWVYTRGGSQVSNNVYDQPSVVANYLLRRLEATRSRYLFWAMGGIVERCVRHQGRHR